MNWDKRILTIAIILLLLQILWLLGDLGFINLPILHNRNLASGQSVGHIVSVQNNVRRRAMSQVVWQEGRSQDDVLAYDALLTLENSTTKVQLNNGSELSLSENTLVFLEPLEGASKDERIRIRFAHGSLRSKLTLNPADFEGESWTLTPSEGAEFQMKTSASGEMEVELNHGQLKATKDGKEINVTQGQVVELSANGIQDTKSISPDLAWPQENLVQRVYAHQSPVAVSLKWRGPASKIEIQKNGAPAGSIDVTGDHLNKSFEFGTYEVRLISQKNVSNWLRLQVWVAPLIHLMAPLPRDRYQINEQVQYIWLKPFEVPQVNWNLNEGKSSTAHYNTQKSDSGSLKYKSEKLGEMNWYVVGLDSEGYQIPPAYSNPIYFVPEPLSAPVLHAPDLRKPAEDDGASLPVGKKYHWWEILIQAFESKALAQADLNRTFNPKTDGLHFTWDTVHGADHYIIEICETPDFRSPVIEKKIDGAEFDWNHIHIRTQEFYWRVASGSKYTMGRFSDVAKVSIQDLRSGKLVPGIKVVKGVVLPLKEKVDASKPVSEQPLPKPKSLVSDRVRSVFGGVDYETAWFKDSANSTYNYTGPVYRVRYQEDRPWSATRRAGGLVQAQYVSWKEVDGDSIMTTQRYSEIRIRALAWNGKIESSWSYAFGLGFISFPARTGLETAQFNSGIMADVGMFYDFKHLFGMEGKLGLIAGSSGTLSELSAVLFGQKKLTWSEKTNWYWSPDVQLDYDMTSTGTIGTRYQLGVSLGVLW